MNVTSNLAAVTLAALLHVVGVNGRGSPVMRPMSHVSELKWGENYGWVASTHSPGEHVQTMRISEAEAERVALYLAGLEVKPTSENDILQWVRSRKNAGETPQLKQLIYEDNGTFIVPTGKRPPTPDRKGPPAVYNPKE